MAQTMPGASAKDAPTSGPGVQRRQRTGVVSLLLFGLALLCLVVGSAKVGINPFGSSYANHFVYQAQSFLQGRLDIPHLTVTDIVQVNGKYYVIYPPFPALLMLPFVAIFGPGFSDTFFTQVCSALNIVLLFWLLETLRVSGRSGRTFQQNMALSIFFFFGTINWYLSLGGTVWFTAHIVAATCTLAFLLLAFKRCYVLSGLCLGFAFLTRAPAAAGLPVLVYLLLETRLSGGLRKPSLEWLQRVPWRKLSLALAPLSVMILVYLVRNALIFGNPWETGYALLQIQQHYPQPEYGILSIHYIWPNVVADFLAFPSFTFRKIFDITPQVDLLRGAIGISVFATTPLFLFLFFIRNQTPSALRRVLWASVGLIVASALLFDGTGFAQFGARYLFEAYPYAFLLLALSEIEMGWRFYLLGMIGIFVNFLGAKAFWNAAF